MKLTKSKLQQMIKEEFDLMQEEGADCLRDYQAGLITKEQYENCVRHSETAEDDWLRQRGKRVPPRPSRSGTNRSY